ncbi:esterase-like activity of phytase family protein [Fulvimarina sp. 2208YS6-2-32]|uniref:Esterase-like activity of phytase family protein n=1 Tax=Fulvimarina uroteuthidis TaxID=3098149 RepID=A0ABU5HXV9_9HYPH|nr:esterase-like activity of phytase family protein [Fulvimarina sp. 2208YS6-2-32]MDY8107972.1 esterase-like activity of phytase family protein [Fulvimarina sp. 2208YS6-2-32]
MSAGLLVTLCLSVLPAAAQSGDGREFPATLAGQVVLAADSIVPAPDDAPDALKSAGTFTGATRRRTLEPGSVPGMDGLRPTGFATPIEGQSLQGFSGIKAMQDGTYWTMSDNGFGAKANSADAMLMLHNVALDWETGTLDRRETVFLSDPNAVAPFPIAMEGTPTRYLTGADFDVESIQPVEDGFWVGEEFGPYLLKFDRQGRLKAMHDTMIGDTAVSSPDHPDLRLPADPASPMPAFNLKRSGGFEGLALSPDGAKLYGLLEGPVFVDGQAEATDDGRDALRIVEFDVASNEWTGRSWLYPLAEGATAIGDFNMIDDSHALVIERDGGAGLQDQACAGEPAADCFATPAKLKRVAKIAMSDESVGGPVAKLGYIDLLAIEDPDAKARQGGANGRYTMPFVTIENVDRVDETHIVVGNDNNFPFSAGRSLTKADDNEFVLLEAGELLRAE